MYKKMSESEISRCLESHRLWLRGDPLGVRADFSRVDLSHCDLSNTNLKRANLSWADLRHADLSYADLSFSDFTLSDMSGANLECANLECTNLFSADLIGANLHNIKVSSSTQWYFTHCPEEGSFIGWKLCEGHGGYSLVKLKILKDAKRSSATTNKCRCDKAKVLAIYDYEMNEVPRAWSFRDSNFVYEIGKTVFVEDFDENRWNECSTGIHFFLTKEEALRHFFI